MNTSLLIIILLSLFGMLAAFDGVYLHLFKYHLPFHKSSQFEHLTHTVRSFCFLGLLILFFRFNISGFFWYLGLGILAVDLLFLGLDAYHEKDSRAFMGGLPRWEYIVHLFVNGFHFGAIVLVFTLKPADAWHWSTQFNPQGYTYALSLFVDLLWPGALLLSLLHLAFYNKSFKKWWRDKLGGAFAVSEA